MERDLTKGSVFKTILVFSLPYLLSYFLQTFYGMADLFIIGQFDKVDGTTAVSIGSQIMHMITVMIVGLAMGSTVMIGRAIGGKDRKMAKTAIGNTVFLFAVLSIAVTVVALIFTEILVMVMSTPAEAVEDTKIYLYICFAGIPFITAYNIISSIFRGMGDTKSPMCFVAIACVFNIAFDLLFIGVFGLGALGAALGTTLSQTISVIISILAIRKKDMFPGMEISDFCPKKNVLNNILKVGIPVSVQDGFIQIAFIVITVFANQRGLEDAAAVGIVEKLIGILFLVPSSMLSTVSALAAQNIGAGKHDRVKKILKLAIGITVSFGIISAFVMQLFSEPIVGLFTGDDVVIKLGGQYMRGYVWDCVLAGIHFCFSGYFCAYGLSGISFLHNFISIVVARIPLAYFAAVNYKDTLFPMGVAAPIGSALSIVICVIAYIKYQK